MDHVCQRNGGEGAGPAVIVKLGEASAVRGDGELTQDDLVNPAPVENEFDLVQRIVRIGKGGGNVEGGIEVALEFRYGGVAADRAIRVRVDIEEPKVLRISCKLRQVGRNTQAFRALEILRVFRVNDLGILLEK